MPVVACAHLIHQFMRYPGPRSEMFVTLDPTLAPKVAAIEASLSVCETFSAMVLPLAAVSMYKRHAKRFFATVTVGLICYISNTTLAVLSPIPTTVRTNLSRMPLVHGRVFTAILTAAIGLLVAAALYVWIQIALVLRTSKKQSQDAEAQSTELRSMQRRMRQAVECADQSATSQVEVEVSSHLAAMAAFQQNKQSKQVAWLSLLTLLFLPSSLAASLLSLEGATALGSLRSLAWRLSFFMPESNVTISELDQAVALAGGAATLAFNCYDAYRSWMES